MEKSLFVHKIAFFTPTIERQIAQEGMVLFG